MQGKNKKINKIGRKEMIEENELDYVDMTDQELANYHLQEAIEHAQTTLQLAENCYRKFGKQLLSEIQKSYFQNVANGILPTDEEQAALDDEQITLDMQAVKQARQAAIKKCSELGEAYTPELVFQDRTDSSVS